MAGFKSEWWPESNRNGGRLQIGISGRIASEFAGSGTWYWPALARDLVFTEGAKHAADTGGTIRPPIRRKSRGPDWVLVDSFIDEDDLIGIKRGLIFAPDLPLQRDVGAKLLAGVKCFFEANPVRGVACTNSLDSKKGSGLPRNE